MMGRRRGEGSLSGERRQRWLRTFFWVGLVVKYVGIALYVVGIVVHGFRSDLSEIPGLVAVLGSGCVMAYYMQLVQDAEAELGRWGSVATWVLVIGTFVMGAHEWYETAIWAGIVGTTVVGLLNKRAVESASSSMGLPSGHPR